MKVTTKSRYAIRAIFALTYLGGAEKPVALAQISESESISRKYLEQIFIQLKKNNLVKGSRGAAGGYMLSREPSEITLKEIIYIMDGPVTPVACTEAEKCERFSVCQINWLWLDLKEMVDGYFENITIGDLIKSIDAGAKNADLS